MTVPPAPHDRCPAILCCPGLSGRKDLVLPFVTRQFAEAGIASLAIDYRGYGESEGARGWIDPAARVDDCRRALDYLAERPEVDRGRLGVYGLSLGGPVAITVAAEDARIRVVVAVSPPGDGEALLRSLRTEPEWRRFQERLREERAHRALGRAPSQVDLTEIFPFSQRFLRRFVRIGAEDGTSTLPPMGSGNAPHKVFLASVDAILAFKPTAAAARLGDRPLLVIAGEEDDVARPEQVRTLFDRASGPKELVLMPRRDHIDLDTGEGLVEQVRIARDWFVLRLGAGPDRIESASRP